MTLNGVKDEETDLVLRPVRNKRRAQDTDDMEQDTQVEVRTFSFIFILFIFYI